MQTSNVCRRNLVLPALWGPYGQTNTRAADDPGILWVYIKLDGTLVTPRPRREATRRYKRQLHHLIQTASRPTNLAVRGRRPAAFQQRQELHQGLSSEAEESYTTQHQYILQRARPWQWQSEFCSKNDVMQIQGRAHRLSSSAVNGRSDGFR